jgi:transcriptional regulator with XRE-family HTH domain
VIVVEPIDPALFERADLRVALAAHDIGAVYRTLRELGISQRRIAVLTGPSQSEVSEIVHGREVHDYRVLVRIAEGLGIPREWMGLSFGAYPESAVAKGLPREVVEAMRRRVPLALAGMTLMGQPVPGLGEVSELPRPLPVPLPSRVVGLHVVKVQELTRRLGETRQAYGADPFVSSAAAEWAVILLATIHVRAGESDGAQLAHEAITGAMKLSSARVRQRLELLAAALEARPRSDHHDLACTARHVACTARHVACTARHVATTRV